MVEEKEEAQEGKEDGKEKGTSRGQPIPCSPVGRNGGISFVIWTKGVVSCQEKNGEEEEQRQQQRTEEGRREGEREDGARRLSGWRGKRCRRRWMQC